MASVSLHAHKQSLAWALPPEGRLHLNNSVIPRDHFNPARLDVEADGLKAGHSPQLTLPGTLAPVWTQCKLLQQQRGGAGGQDQL